MNSRNNTMLPTSLDKEASRGGLERADLNNLLAYLEGEPDPTTDEQREDTHEQVVTALTKADQENQTADQYNPFGEETVNEDDQYFLEARPSLRIQ